MAKTIFIEYLRMYTFALLNVKILLILWGKIKCNEQAGIQKVVKLKLQSIIFPSVIQCRKKNIS